MSDKPNIVVNKALKKELNQLQHIRNRALVEWATHKLRTYEDMLVDAGHKRETLREYWYDQTQLDKPLTREDILEFYERHKIFIQQTHEGLFERNGYHIIPHEYEGYTYNVPLNVVLDDETNAVVSSDTNTDTPLAEYETLPESPLQNCKLFAFQERAAAKLLRGILYNNYHGQMLRAGVGTGKTFIIGAVIRRLLDMNFCQGKTFSPWPIVYITKASIVEQTERVFKQSFNIDIVTQCRVINIEQLRATFGELMVRCETIVERGEEHIKWKWRQQIHPIVMLLDECQQVKNTDSQQSQILQAYNDITDIPTYQIHFSATPFMRVCEAKCFAVSTRLRTKYGVQSGVALSNNNWSDFAKHTADPADPAEYSPAAIERLMEKLDPYIVDVKGVRPQFDAVNSVQLISFRTEEERKFYNDAWERYEKMRHKIEGYELSGGRSAFLILAQFTIFRKAAELCRAEYLADAMYESVQKGEAACLAVNFKGTIRRVVTILSQKYKVDRDSISLIWGGGKTKKNKKQQAKEVITKDAMMMELLGNLGMSLDDLQLADVEEYVDDDPEDKTSNELRLGIQSMKDRQREIDRFQSGKSNYCMFTFKAGGVGLSLHHTDEFTKQKCRRKKNNWVYPEDVKLIPTKPRVCFLAPTFSAIELVQGLGRCPRLTSLSVTNQIIVFYGGTIEERVAAIVNQKLKCLRKVVRQRESWESCITGEDGRHNDTTKLIDNGVTQKESDDDNPLFGDATGDEDEDEDT